jgi:exodeoxyribonuclease V alpha subunit
MNAGKSVMARETVERLVGEGVLGLLDCHFADFITRLSGEEDFDLFLAAALVSRHTAEGHVCLDLQAVAGRALLAAGSATAAVVCPRLDPWRKKLEANPVVGSPGEECPLLLDEKNRLYLYRYWEYQRDVARFIRECSDAEVEGIDLPLLMRGLARYFPAGPEKTTDWQQIAAFTSVVKKFCVISGGPGTGKTTTVARVLALLLEQAEAGKLRIALAAPTGKAAARLEEAITAARRNLDCPAVIREAFPTGASTLHRLLGTIPGSPYFLHDRRSPLPVDAVIVDEASMVDLALLAKLIWALPRHARLILVGDKDQLASVEAGSVLGDICDTGNRHPFCGALPDLPGSGAGSGFLTGTAWQKSVTGFEQEASLPWWKGSGEGGGQSVLPHPAGPPQLEGETESGLPPTVSEQTEPVLETDSVPQDREAAYPPRCAGPEGPGRSSIQHCIVELRNSYRFGTDSGIGAVSRAIKAGDADRALAVLRDESYNDVGWVELPRAEWLPRFLNEIVRRGFAGFGSASSLEELFGALERFRILCALRRGPYGVVAFNHLAERILIDERSIFPDQWYPGRPILITSNDYELKLFNGDVGVIIAEDWPSLQRGRRADLVADRESDSAVRACFASRAGEFRQFPPARLPEHETVYAMTVHKSQGSEFSEVLLILPDRQSPVLTRELLYTGITRAREKVTVWGREEVFRAAVATTVRRSSGLRDALWEA